MNTMDFIQLFQQFPALAVVIDTDFTIVAASDAFLQVTKSKRENIIGRDIFRVFPDNPGDLSARGERVIRNSFNRVITTKLADTLPFVKYDIPKPESEGGGFEVKYWQAINTPVLDEMNNVKYIIQRVEDVTENATLIQRINKQQKIGEAYKAGNDYVRNIFMQAPALVCLLRGPEHVYELANEKYLKLVGNKDIIGKPIRKAFPELEGQGFFELLDEVYKTGKSFVGNEMPAKFYPGSPMQEDIYLDFVYQATYDNKGTIDGILVHGINVTEQVLLRKKIEDSEKRYNMMLMHSPFTFAVLKGKDLVIALANDRVKAVWGKGNDVEGKSLLEIMPELNDTPFPALMDEVIATGIPYHGREVQSPHNIHGHAREEYFNFVFQPYWEADQTISGITIIGYDVTEQVIAKRKIKESEFRFHNMVYTSPSMIAIFKGEDMIIEIANDSIMESWGKGKDIIGKSLLSIMPEIIEQGFDKILSDVYKTGIPFHAYEAPISLLRNGKLEVLHYTFVYQAQRNIKGEIEGVAVIANEVTPQAKMNLKLRESEERFRSLADNVPMHIFIAEPNAEASISYFNNYWLDYTGQTIEEAIGRTWDGIIHPDDVQLIMDIYVPAFEKRQPYILPAIRVRGYDGAYRWFQVHAKPRYLPNGEFMGFIGAGFDIHESKLAINALKESESHFRQLADLMPAKISNADPAGNVTYFNKHWLDYSGYSFEELRDFGYHKIMHPDELDEFQKRLQIAGETCTVLEMQMRFMHKEGDYRWHLNLASPIKDENGHIKMWVGSTTDIHEQKTVSEKIKTSEERFRLLVQQAPVAICVVRGENYVVEIVNAGMLEFWGRTEAQILYNPIFKVLTELDGQVFEALVDDVYTTGQRFVATEFPITLLRKGQLENAYVTFVYEPLREVDGTISGIMVLAHEITDLVVARKKIEAQVIMHKEMLMNAPYVACTLEGPNHVFSLVNEQYQQLFGSRILKGKPFLKALPEMEGQGFDKLLDKIYNTGETYVGFDIPVTFAREEGHTPELGYFNFSYQPMFDENRKIYSILGFGYEVTEIVKAKLIIEESELRFRVLTNSMPQKITNADAAGNMIFFNQKWLDDTGLTFDELKDWGWEKSIHTDDLKLTVSNWKHSVATGDVFDMECRIQNKEGDYRWHLSRAVPIKDEAGKIVMWVGSNTDIHEQKEQKEELENIVSNRTSELLQKNLDLEKANKDLTSFTYVSSHDLQEPLRKIQNFATVILLEEERNLSETGKGYFLRMTQTAKRMQALIEDLLTYSRAKNGERIIETVDLNLLLDEVRIDFEEVIRQKNAIIEADLCEARVIPFQFRQLMQNLISNSLKFSNPNLPPHIIMKSKIATGDELRESCQPESQEKLIGNKKYCHIHFTDNGIGFEPQYKERIFEVFQRLHSFEEYAGTGIGLAICRRIIENHDGIITATGKLNEGAQFEIYIPA